jgi:hypothetical protein
VSSSISTVIPSGAASQGDRFADLTVEGLPDVGLQPRMRPSLGRHGHDLAGDPLEPAARLRFGPKLEFMTRHA